MAGTTIEIDTTDLEDRIVQRILKSLKPVLAKSKADNDTIFTVKTLSEYLGCKERWIRDRVYFKEIPFVKLGGLLKFKKSSIDKWIASQETPAINNPPKLFK